MEWNGVPLTGRLDEEIQQIIADSSNLDEVEVIIRNENSPFTNEFTGGMEHHPPPFLESQMQPNPIPPSINNGFPMEAQPMIPNAQFPQMQSSSYTTQYIPPQNYLPGVQPVQAGQAGMLKIFNL